MNDERRVDWYQPTVLLSTFTSRRQRIISIWYSAESSSASPRSAVGNGKLLVTSSVEPMSRPSSWPVTNAGSACWQCFTIFNTTRPSSSTASIGCGGGGGAGESEVPSPSSRTLNIGKGFFFGWQRGATRAQAVWQRRDSDRCPRRRQVQPSALRASCR